MSSTADVSFDGKSETGMPSVVPLIVIGGEARHPQQLRGTLVSRCAELDREDARLFRQFVRGGPNSLDAPDSRRVRCVASDLEVLNVLINSATVAFVLVGIDLGVRRERCLRSVAWTCADISLPQ